MKSITVILLDYGVDILTFGDQYENLLMAIEAYAKQQVEIESRKINKESVDKLLDAINTYTKQEIGLALSKNANTKDVVINKVK